MEGSYLLYFLLLTFSNIAYILDIYVYIQLCTYIHLSLCRLSHYFFLIRDGNIYFLYIYLCIILTYIYFIYVEISKAIIILKNAARVRIIDIKAHKWQINKTNQKKENNESIYGTNNGINIDISDENSKYNGSNGSSGITNETGNVLVMVRFLESNAIR